MSKSEYVVQVDKCFSLKEKFPQLDFRVEKVSHEVCFFFKGKEHNLGRAMSLRANIAAVQFVLALSADTPTYSSGQIEPLDNINHVRFFATICLLDFNVINDNEENIKKNLPVRDRAGRPSEQLNALEIVIADKLAKLANCSLLDIMPELKGSK